MYIARITKLGSDSYSICVTKQTSSLPLARRRLTKCAFDEFLDTLHRMHPDPRNNLESLNSILNYAKKGRFPESTQDPFCLKLRVV